MAHNLGSLDAQAFGNALGSGLQMLTNHKLNEIATQKQQAQSAQFWKSLGLSDQEAIAVASQPKEIQKSFLDRLEGASFGQQFNQSPVNTVNTKDKNELNPKSVTNSLNLLYGNDQSLDKIGGKNGSNLKLGANPVERRHREVLDQKKDIAAYKETKDLRHKLIEDRKLARQELKDLSRLQELNEEGKLDTPGYVEFLQRSGFDIPALMNPESEEFQKIQQGFLKGAKQYFGARVTDNEINMFLKTIPTLSQSAEGRKRVIAMLKDVARGKEEYYQAYKDVMNENNGKPPLDLEEQIENKVESRLDKIAEKFKADLQRPVPKGQNKLITALQAGAGSVVPKIPKALAGAGLGAAAGSRLGSVFGIPGTIGGAALGGLAGLSGLGVKDIL